MPYNMPLPPGPAHEILHPMTDAETFETVCALQAEGQYLSAYDHAMAALAAGADHDGLRHRAVLMLAQSGATASALLLFGRLGMAASTEPEIAALGARLLKDQALSGAPGAVHAAETAYARLFARSREAWHGVNAAAMALMAGAPARARSRIEAIGIIPDTGDFWSAATLAEAALLCNDPAACTDWLATAEARAGADVNARRTTRRQLRWMAPLLGADPLIVDILRIPPSVHFCGVIPQGPDAADPALEAVLRTQLAPALDGVRTGFGSAAAGADLIVAEILLDQGADLTLVLPFPPEAFAQASVLPSGPAWLPRFRACLARARVIVLEISPQDDLDFAMASRRAMGLARLHATRIDGKVWQVAVPQPGASKRGPAGTASDIETWQGAGGTTRRLDSPWQPKHPGAPTPPQRGLDAVLFGDLPGFGALDDGALAAFYAGPLAAVGPLVADAIYRNAWGDAVQLVFESPAAAARCALAIQRTLSAEAFLAWGLPPTPHPPPGPRLRPRPPGPRRRPAGLEVRRPRHDPSRADRAGHAPRLRLRHRGLRLRDGAAAHSPRLLRLCGPGPDRQGVRHPPPLRRARTLMPHPLSAIALFDGVPDDVLTRLAAQSRPIDLAGEGGPATAGPRSRDMVFRQDDPADAAYAIIGGAGRIRVGVPGQEAKRLMVEVFQTGDVFGEIGVLESAPRTADAHADGPVRLLRIPAAAFLTVLAEQPRLGINLSRLLAARLRRTFTLFQDASFETIEVRLARQVLYLAERGGRRTERGIRIPGQLRQPDLADLLGTTTRSVITVLNAWRARHLVSYDGDKALLVILDPPNLRALLSDE